MRATPYFLGCGGHKGDGGGGRAVPEEAKELARRHFEEIWNQRNLAVCDEIMAEEYFEHAAAPFSQSILGRVNGPQGMRRTVEWLLAQFPDLQLTIEAIVADGDTVAVRVLSEGTNLGALNEACRLRASALAPARATGSGLRRASW